MSFPIQVSVEALREKIRRANTAPGQFYAKHGNEYFAYSSLNGRSVGQAFGTIGECKEWLKEIEEEGEKKDVRNSDN